MWNIFKEHKLWFLIPITIIMCYGILLIIFIWPISEFSISKAGQFGDSFGILNSMFSGFAFISLVITIYLQQKEMTDTKEEIIKQNFENTFFKMIDLYSNVIKNLNFKSTYKNEYFSYTTIEIKKYFNKVGTVELTHENEINLNGKEVIVKLLEFFLKYKSIIDNKKNSYKPIINKYEDFYKEFEIYIGHYFVTIYQILKFIDESNLDNKKSYSDLFRGQFSNPELNLLFYHSTSNIAKKNLTPFLIKYEFFEQLNINKMDADSIEIIISITKKLNREFSLNYSDYKIFGKS